MAGGVVAKAERFGVSKSTVGNWQTGASKPDGAKRERIFEAGGPEPDSWDEVFAPPAAPVQLPDDSPLREPTADDTASIAAGLLRYLQGLQRELETPGSTGDMTLPERVRMADQLAAAVDKLGKHTGVRLTTRQILASPLWGEVTELVVSALEPYPDAMHAVIKTLETMKAT